MWAVRDGQAVQSEPLAPGPGLVFRQPRLLPAGFHGSSQGPALNPVVPTLRQPLLHPTYPAGGQATRTAPTPFPSCHFDFHQSIKVGAVKSTKYFKSTTKLELQQQKPGVAKLTIE